VLGAVREAGVFFMEAFMYRCHPQTHRLVELICDGAIGRVRLVQASFSFRGGWNPEGRLLNRALGGGGILDVGCYCASMARLIAGASQGTPFEDPIDLKAAGHIGETGVDEFTTALLEFPGGMLAQLATGVRVTLDNHVRVWGEAGHIEVPSPWVINGGEPGETKLILHADGAGPVEISIQADRSIYAIEADTVAESIGNREAAAMPHSDSLGNMKTLDRWRAAIGLRYDIAGEPL
jgi:predicted dehydrogenase